MAERELIKTGIHGLDELFFGGILRGNIILVEGAPGMGKTTIGLEFIYRGITEFDEPGLVVSFEVSREKLIRDVASFGWDFADLERRGKLKIVFTSREVLCQEIQQADSILLSEAAEIGARRILIDSIAWSFPQETERTEAFRTLASGLERHDLTALLNMDIAEFQSSTMPERERFIADTIVRLGMKRQQSAVQRTLEIVKSRGQDYLMGTHTFSILKGKGIEVYQRAQMRRSNEREEAAAFKLGERIPTGIPGLDELVNGGYLIGSSTLVAGVSGTGKTVMGLQYLNEGFRRGERGLMITLDEPPGQVLRNAAAIGIDFKAAIDGHLMRLSYESPQELEIDRHFAQIEQLVQTFKPRRAVIDSLYTYESNIGTVAREYRDFLHAVVALLKEYQVTAIYNHENPEILGMSSMMGTFSASSLVDNIILLNWVELGDTFRHALTIAKLRANPTNRTTHECGVADGGGMRVYPSTLTGIVPSRPFSSYTGLISRSPERYPESIIAEGKPKP